MDDGVMRGKTVLGRYWSGNRRPLPITVFSHRRLTPSHGPVSRLRYEAIGPRFARRSLYGGVLTVLSAVSEKFIPASSTLFPPTLNFPTQHILCL